MNILITGAAGLIGSHLADKLLMDGHNVIGIDNLSFGSIDNLKIASKSNNFIFHKNNSGNYLNIDFVFHLASGKKAYPNSSKGLMNQMMSCSEVLRNNSQMIVDISDYCVKNNVPMIFTSTSDVYGDHPDFKESSSVSIGPTNIERYSYAMTKLFEEQYLLNLCSENKLRVCIPRIFGCFSERSKKGWSAGHIPIFINNALNDKDIVIHGDGKQTRTMVYVSDIIEGLILMMNNFEKLNGEIINLGGEEEMTILSHAMLIKEITNSKSEIKFIGEEIAHGKYKDIKRRKPDLTKIKKLIGYKQMSDFKQSLIKVIKNWKENNERN